MAQLSRTSDAEIENGNIIDADDLDAEFDNIISGHNTNDTTLTAVTTGTYTFSGVKTFSSTPKTNGIDERTAGSGVTVDSLLIKDGVARPTLTADPASPVDGDFWYNSTDDKFRGRVNGVTVDMGDPITAIESRSSNTILAVADKGKTLIFTSTFTQTFTAAATLGAKWYVDLRNDGTGIITLDLATDIYMFPGEAFRIVCDGSGFYTIGRAPAGSWILAETISPDGSASTADSTFGYVAGYDHKWELTVDMASDNVGFDMRISLDGSTFRSTAGDYSWLTGFFTTTFAGSQNTSDTEITIADTSSGYQLGDAAGEPPHTYVIEGYRLDTSDAKKDFMWKGRFTRAFDGQDAVTHGDGIFKGTTGAILGVRFLSTVNFSATIYHYVKRRV